MEKYILIILMFISSVSYGQGYSNLGNTNPNDTARVMYNWFLPMKGIRLPFYSNSDSNFLLIRPSTGYVVRYSLSQLINRVSASIGIPGLQQVLNVSNDLDSDNDIAFGQFRFGLNGYYLQLDNDSVTSTGLIEYTDNRRNEYKERTLPDWENVKDTVSQAVESLRVIVDQNEQAALDSISVLRNLVTTSSFDTTLTVNATTLNSPRFTRVLSTINYGGMTWNSSYFTQNTGTGSITLINDLILYADKKYTFTLR